MFIQLSSEYTERTCGLCGNYNGNQGDDFLTFSGLVETLVEDFGNSWKLKGDCQDLQKQESDSCHLNPHLGTAACLQLSQKNLQGWKIIEYIYIPSE